MGVITAPLTGSGGWPAWMASVSRDSDRLSAMAPCTIGAMPTRREDLVPPGLVADGPSVAGSIFVVTAVRRGSALLVLKRLRPRMLAEPAALDALDREAEVLTRMRHPALVELVERSKDAHGPYLVETRAPGRSLAELAARGPLPAPLWVALAEAAFSALAELHAEGLALGDLSPEDIIAGERAGQLAFVDLGQASWEGRPPLPEARGTLPFVPPAVAAGHVPWSQAADTYALAAILAFAAAGRRLSSREGGALLVEVVEGRLDIARALDRDELPAAWVTALKRACGPPSERLTGALAVLLTGNA